MLESCLGIVGVPTGLVLLGLIMGKPLGITLFTWIAARIFKLEIPGGMSYRHVFTLGTVAGIGFTVALFMSEAAFPAGQFPGEPARCRQDGRAGQLAGCRGRLRRGSSVGHPATGEPCIGRVNSHFASIAY